MKTLELARLAMGLGELFCPQPLHRAATGTPPSPGAVLLMRVLGARHVVQAMVLLRAGTMEPGGKTWHRCGGLVDLAHAATMVAVASGGRRWRRAAAIDAAVASTFAALEAR